MGLKMVMCLTAGKFNKHVDLWDSNQNNKFFSLEGFLFVQRQMINFSKPPNLVSTCVIVV